MSSSVNGLSITLTRGDTFVSDLTILDVQGEPYIPTSSELVRFEMRKYKTDAAPLLAIDIPIHDPLRLELKPEQTASLPYGYYVYDISLTRANGDVDTFITDGEILIQ